MNKEKISLQEVADLLASKASVSKRVAEDFLKVLFNTVEDGLMAGETVKIKNFGTFKLHWNEPRKSVNIQTGEEILLAGYNKVLFVPDAILKDLVNEPYAHLQPVEINSDSSEKVHSAENEVELDPLRIFTEQASEIKDLISEIQALSSNSQSTIVEEVAQSDTKAEEITVFEEPVEIKLQSAEVIDEANNIEDIQDVEPEKINESDVNEIEESNDDYSPNPFLDDIKPSKKRKFWPWLLISILIIGATGTGLFYMYPPANNLINNSLILLEINFKSFKETASFTELLNTVSKWVSPSPKEIPALETIIIPKDSDSTEIMANNKPVDSLQILFDTPRVYPVFIASERIRSGSRLTKMAKRYYGTPDFWVYIYEANKDRISNPDIIPSNTLIHIPKLDPRLIDATNPRCIKKAKELHDLYVKK
ncbi:MAG: HU family DNA-binding protein [Paludibacter sp.]